MQGGMPLFRVQSEGGRSEGPSAKRKTILALHCKEIAGTGKTLSEKTHLHAKKKEHGAFRIYRIE